MRVGLRDRDRVLGNANGVGWRGGPNAVGVAYVAVFAIGLAWAVQLCLRSTGFTLDDEIGHYLIARHVVEFPQNLIDLWGRPLMTALYAIPAQGGMRSAQLFSVLVSASTVLVATWLGSGMGVRQLFLVPLLMWFQPWFGDLSYAVVPQALFGLWLTAAIAAWAFERYELASVMFGLLPLTRHEGVALTLVWFAWMVVTRRWRPAVIAIAPDLLFNIGYAAVQRSWAFDVYGASQYSSFYGRGGWFHFVVPLLMNVGLPVVVLAAAGCWASVRRQPRHLALFAGFALYFLVHTVIFHFGLFESGGYHQFLIPLASIFAVTAALGTEWLMRRAGEIRDALAGRIAIPPAIVPAGVAAVLVLTVAYGMRRPPHRLSAEHLALRAASDWIKQSGRTPPRVAAANVYFCYVFPVSPAPHKYWATPPQLSALPPGSIVVWDRHYAARAGMQLADLDATTGDWQRLATFGSNAFAIVFEKRGRSVMVAPVGSRVEADAQQSPSRVAEGSLPSFELGEALPHGS